MHRIQNGKEQKMKIKYGNEIVEGEIVKFSISDPTRYTYTLEDGTILNVDFVLQKVIKVKDKYDEEGNPSYMVYSRNVINVTSPDNLRKVE